MPPVESSSSQNKDTIPHPNNTKDNHNHNNHNPTHPTTKTTTTRRSARTKSGSSAAEIVAPGFGTRRDLERLARELSYRSSNNDSTNDPALVVLPVEAVHAMMTSRGRGIRSSSRNPAATAAASASASTPVSSAWADFMKEEGVVDAVGRPAAETTTTTTTTSTSSKHPTTTTTPTSSEPRTTKKAKTVVAPEADVFVGGVLVQTGTLDAASVGRSKTKMDATAGHCLMVPTLLLPRSIRIQTVVTAGHACHSLAIAATTGHVYGWGRNESHQLTARLPTNVYAPVRLPLTNNDNDDDNNNDDDAPRVQSAAVGKSHTILLLHNGSLMAVGANKSGQCGIKTTSSVETVSQFKPCVFQQQGETNAMVQIACGEDFSVALDSEGFLYTTGSSEFGQLGNGETGQYFVTANKLAFANCSVWTQRTTFCHAPGEKTHGTGDKNTKVVPLPDQTHIRLQQIACGKHHTLALEKVSNSESSSSQQQRLWTWGCGDYGVLGHGIQADEYYPRLVGSPLLQRLPTVGASRTAIAAGQHCTTWVSCTSASTRAS